MSVQTKDRGLGAQIVGGKGTELRSVFPNTHVFAESCIRRMTKNLLLSRNEIPYA